MTKTDAIVLRKVKAMLDGYLLCRALYELLRDYDGKTALDAEPKKWITVNGAHIPLDKDGQPAGKAGERLKAATEKSGAASQASKVFADDLEKSLSGKLPRNAPLRMGQTSEALKLAGAGDLPVTMRQDKAKEVMKASDHGLSKETLLAIPAQLHDPVMILDSSTQANSLVVVTEVFDKGKPVVAAVHLNKTSGRLEVNEVASVYGRSGAAGYIKREIEGGKLRYINKSKSSAWGRGLSGLQLPAVMRHAKRFDGKKILTERDTVNKKNSPAADSIPLRRPRLTPHEESLLAAVLTLITYHAAPRQGRV